MKRRILYCSLGAFICLVLFAFRTYTLVYAVAPTVTLNAPSAITSSSVTLNGSFNPNSVQTTAYFRYWSNNPGNCIDAGGTRVPSPTGGTTQSVAGSYAFSQVVNNLLPNTTYYYCAIATNTSAETSYHATTTSSFTTANAPQNPCDITPDTTGGVAIPAGICQFPPTSGSYTGMDGGTLTLSTGLTLTLAAGQTVVFQGVSKQSGAVVSKNVGGVMRKGYVYVKDTDNDGYYVPNSTTFSSDPADATLLGQGYKRRKDLVGTGAYLTQALDCNDNNAAQTIPSTCAPTGTVGSSVTNITATSATLNGGSNPGGDAGTQAYFKYGTVNTGECDTLHTNSGASTSASLITGTTSQPFSANITGLTGGTTYYWCPIVFNNLGTTYGTIGSFIPIGPPTGVSLTGVTQTNITVNWTPPSGAAGFKIYRCAGSLCTPTSYLVTDSNNASPHADSTVTCGNWYGYQVTATTGSGGTGSESSKSSPIVYSQTSSCISAPTLSSPTATSITGTSATLGATVTSNGGANLNARGTCWSTTDTTPQLGEVGVNCLAEGGTAVSAFSHSRTGLPASSTIYYSGYATNTSSLTGYTFGSFSTPALLANGSNCTTGSECQSGNCYVDVDGDRYAPSGGTKTCNANTQIAGTDCYDANPATTNSELAYPGASTFRTTTRGTSGVGNDASGNSWNSYDYNCDSVQTQQYTVLTNYPYSCTSSCTSAQNTPGWQNTASPPACGVAWIYSTACHRYGTDTSCNFPIGDSGNCSGSTSCFSTDTTYTQGCR